MVISRHVEGMRELLDGSLGGDVVVKTQFDADTWPIQVDEGELGIALLNLCVNARDAMPGGGTITIAARNRANFTEYQLEGDFVELSVTDTGEGMDPATISALPRTPSSPPRMWARVRGWRSRSSLWIRARILGHHAD